MSKSSPLEFSFAVGSPDGERSGIWKVRVWKNDVYVAPREAMPVAKLSLHKDGNCFFKITDEHHDKIAAKGQNYSGKSLFAKWRRPDEFPAMALVLTFPSLALTPGAYRQSKHITWIEKPAEGKAVKVGFIYLPTHRPGMEIRGRHDDQVLGYCDFQNRLSLAVFARQLPFDATPHLAANYGQRATVAAHYPVGTGPRDGQFLRGMFFNEPPSVGMFELTEMVIRVQRRAA